MLWAHKDKKQNKTQYTNLMWGNSKVNNMQQETIALGPLFTFPMNKLGNIKERNCANLPIESCRFKARKQQHIFILHRVNGQNHRKSKQTMFQGAATSFFQKQKI